MEFFQSLDGMLGDDLVTIRIKKKNGQLTVCVLPEAFGNIKGVEMTGTPEDMDGGFMDTIRRPLEKVYGLTSNAAEVEQLLDKAGKAKDAGKKEEAKAAGRRGKKEDPQPAETTPAAEPAETPAAEINTVSAAAQQPETAPASSGAQPAPAQHVYKDQDRVLVQKGEYAGKVGSIIDSTKQDSDRQLLVELDFGQGMQVLELDQVTPYKASTPTAAPAPAVAAQPAPAPPPPPRPGPPKPPGAPAAQPELSGM